MLYNWVEFNRALAHPARMAAKSGSFIFSYPMNPISHTAAGRSVAALCEVFERATRPYGKPQFDLETTVVDGKTVEVQEHTVWRRPFCNIVHFSRDIPFKTKQASPRILLVAPMSGHYATLLRGTVEALLPHAEVYITDWVDARMVPVSSGMFHLDDYIEYLIEMMELFDGDVHAVAVCQPSVALMAAVSHMEEQGSRNVPNSMTLMGGPIDTRVNPTAVNDIAQEKDIDWFRKNVLSTVPWIYPGGGRRVYPGFLQLSSFMAMNFDTHAQSHRDHFFDLIKGDDESAEKHQSFYDEYLAVMDLTAEFYLETVEKVFIKKLLPQGKLTYRNHKIDPSQIRNVPLMTIEGELDDITGVGQCKAAHDLCSKLPASKRAHYEQKGVGHYGIFNGSRFRKFVLPEILKFVAKQEPSRRSVMRRMGLDVLEDESSS
ncbi:MAG: esterase [Rhodomicrobium sp.]|nr:MAG: esterase [Rhodomicrobium sp.]